MKWGVVFTDDSGLHNEIFNNMLFRDGGISVAEMAAFRTFLREFIGYQITSKDAQSLELLNEIFTIHNKGWQN